MTIRVLVNGASGRMGQTTVNAITTDSELTLVGETDHHHDLVRTIKDSQADVVVDFTTADVVYDTVNHIIDAKAHPVIGTSGLLPEQIDELKARCTDLHLGGIIAPNFSIGAILLIQFAEQAAQYLPHVEIIEYHHDQKRDAPSGTAVKTADVIAKVRTPVSLPVCKEILPAARGANLHDIPIHAVRLPGFMAHQEVIFGNLGETLHLKHNSINRECFMPGVLMACKQVTSLDTLVYGLESLL